jgi:murein DD-endopeptidase
MKKIIQQLNARVLRENTLPRNHAYAILSLFLFTSAAVWLIPHHSRHDLIQDKPLPKPQVENADADAALAQQAANTEFVDTPKDLLQDDDSLPDLPDSASAKDIQPLDYTVKDDDNLSYIFDSLNISQATLQQLMSADKTQALTRIKAGQKLSFELDNNNVLQHFILPLNGTQSLEFTLKDDTYTTQTLTDNPLGDAGVETKSVAAEPTRVLHGVINKSFASDALDAGLGYTQISRIIKLFQGKIDFRRDLRAGDSFEVLMDKPTASGQALDDAEILAIVLQVKGKNYAAYRGPDQHYYDEKGQDFSYASNGKFMRYPIPGDTKVSSGFDPARKNPVTGRVMPHNGVDFPVHVGTKVVATGDGVIVKAARSPSTGIYIVLRNSSRYSSVYMHLSKALVKPGQKVTMGQAIALSGNTGRTTGPHLHYEFHINNRAVNPLRADLPINNAGQATKNQKLMKGKIKQYNQLLANNK